MAARKIRMGIVGMTNDHVWSMGQSLAALPTVELVAGAEPHVELREQVRARFGLQTVYDDYRAMFARERLDAILVCSDNASKVTIIEEAAKHGLHVYADKPMAATLAQADRICAAAERSGIKVMIAYHFYFGSTYVKTGELLRAGRIGNVYLARGSLGHAGPKEFGCSSYFCESLFDKQKNGGGAFADEACYVVSAFLDYMGPVAEVCSFMGGMGWRDYLPADVEENTVTILRFVSGALGMIDVRWGQIGNMPFLQSYHGREGTILTGFDAVRIYARQALPTDLQGWVELPSRPQVRGADEAEHFVHGILENKPFDEPVSLRGARAVQEVIEAGYRSAQTGQAVKLPLG